MSHYHHPDGKVIPRGIKPNPERYILSISNLLVELSRAHVQWVEALKTYHKLTCKETSGTADPHGYSTVITHLDAVAKALKNAQAPFMYIESAIADTPMTDKTFIENKLPRIGSALVLRGAISKEVWERIMGTFASRGSLDAHEFIKMCISEFIESVNVFKRQVLNGEPMVTKGRSSWMLGKATAESIDVSIIRLNRTWYLLTETVYVVKLCCVEYWYDLNNFGESLIQSPSA